MKKSIIVIILLSLAFTLVSPFVFNAYVDAKPAELPYKAVFGAPFPYIEQVKELPEDPDFFPVIVEFDFSLDHTGFNIIPFALSMLCFFLLFFSIFTLISRFMDRKPVKKEPN